MAVSPLAPARSSVQRPAHDRVGTACFAPRRHDYIEVSARRWGGNGPCGHAGLHHASRGKQDDPGEAVNATGANPSVGKQPSLGRIPMSGRYPSTETLLDQAVAQT